MFLLHNIVIYFCTFQKDRHGSLVTICHHTKILQSYWLYSPHIHFIPITHLYSNWKFVLLNLFYFFLSSPHSPIALIFFFPTAIVRKQFDRAQALSCSSLQGLAVEAGQTNVEATEPELTPGLSLSFSLWSGRISGQSGSGLSIWSVRAQGPGALQLLPGSPATGRREAGPQFPNSVGWT